MPLQSFGRRHLSTLAVLAKDWGGSSGGVGAKCVSGGGSGEIELSRVLRKGIGLLVPQKRIPLDWGGS